MEALVALNESSTEGVPELKVMNLNFIWILEIVCLFNRLFIFEVLVNNKVF